MFDGEALGKQLVVVVRDYVARAIAGMQAKIEALDERIKAIPAGPRGEDGKDADPEVIARQVREAMATIPRPVDGSSVTLDDIAPIIRAGIAEALATIPAPRDGKDADQEDIARAVQLAVAALPKPADGKDADPALMKIAAEAAAMAASPKASDIEAMVATGIAKALPDAVQSAIDAMMPNLVAMAAAAVPVPCNGADGENGKDGLNGKDGKSVDDAEILASLTEKMMRTIDALPKAVDGRDGNDGRDAPAVDLDAIAIKAASMVPQPKDGKDVDQEMVMRTIVDQVAKAIGAIPQPRDGRDADYQEIAVMIERVVGQIPRPKDGVDGKSFTIEEVRHLMEAEQAKWALEFERRARDELQRAIDRMPAPKDGRDALDLEDLSIEHDGDGMVTFRFARGEVTKEFKIRLPRFKDQGVFREASDYLEGDGVTWAGSFFIAQKDAPTGKPGESNDWRLAVKRGDKGKDFRPDAPSAPSGPVRLK